MQKMLQNELIKTYAQYTIIPISFLVSSYILKRYFSGGVCRSKNRLDGKTVIVTGANCGIGYETALDLAKRGAHIILACRDMKKAQDAADKIKLESKNNNIDIEQLDCASLKSVKEFSDRIRSKYNRLDILINNAGLSAKKFSLTTDGNETTFQVNHLSQFYLTNLLMDLIKSSAPSRIINISSNAHYGAKINWSDFSLENKFSTFRAYQQSKLANVLFTVELTKKLQGTGVTAVSLHPGAVRTEIWRNLKEKPLFSFLITLFYPFLWLIFKDSRQGAQTTIHCAIDDNIQKQNGGYFTDCKLKTPSKEVNSVNAERLWIESSKLVGLE